MNKMKNKMKAKMKLMKKKPRNNKIKEDRMSALATAHVLYQKQMLSWKQTFLEYLI